MGTTSKLGVDEGTTSNIATNTVTEDAVTKHIGRSVLNSSAGVEIGTAAHPLVVMGNGDGSFTGTVTIANPVSTVTVANPVTTVTANLSATDNSVLDAIAASEASIDEKITTCDTGNVTVGACALPSGAATFAAQVSTNALLSGLSSGLATFAAQTTTNELLAGLGTFSGNVTVTNEPVVQLSSGSGSFSLNVTSPAASITLHDDSATMLILDVAEASGSWTTGSLSITDSTETFNFYPYTPQGDMLNVIEASDTGADRYYIPISNLYGNSLHVVQRTIDAPLNVRWATYSNYPLPFANIVSAPLRTLKIEGDILNLPAITGTVTANAGTGTYSCHVTDALPAGDNNIGNVDVVTMPGIVGTVADDATTPGNPVMTGGKAVNVDGTDPGSVAEDDVAIFRTDLNRRQLVSMIHPASGTFTAAYTAAQTDVELVATPGAGKSIYLTDVIISNGATAGTVIIEEDTASAKTPKVGPVYCAINGGAVASFNQPIKLTANKNLGIKSATVTTHSVTVNYFVAP